VNDWRAAETGHREAHAAIVGDLYGVFEH